MQIKWLGHSCFQITSTAGLKLLMDPCDETAGYELSQVPADIITCSHDHFDHHYTAAAAGNPIVIDTPGEHNVNGLVIRGIPCFHDNEQGKKRGNNIIFTTVIDDMRVTHMGDLGHVLTDEQVSLIAGTDIMLIPVGGTYTIDHNEALEIVSKVKPHVLVPMHYELPHLRRELTALAPLLSAAVGWRVHRLNDATATLMPDTLGNRRLLIFNAADGSEIE